GNHAGVGQRRGAAERSAGHVDGPVVGQRSADGDGGAGFEVDGGAQGSGVIDHQSAGGQVEDAAAVTHGAGGGGNRGGGEGAALDAEMCAGVDRGGAGDVEDLPAAEDQAIAQGRGGSDGKSAGGQVEG